MSHKYFDRFASCKFSIVPIHIHILALSSNQTHVNLGILGANKLELSLVAARRDELSVRPVSKDCGFKTQNVTCKI